MVTMNLSDIPSRPTKHFLLVTNESSKYLQSIHICLQSINEFSNDIVIIKWVLSLVYNIVFPHYNKMGWKERNFGED
jgi:hypothetical protein